MSNDVEAQAAALKARMTDLRGEITARKRELRRAEKALIALALQALPPKRRPKRLAIYEGWGCTPDLTPEAAGAQEAPDNGDDEADDEDEYDADDAEFWNFPDTANVAGFCIYDDDKDPAHDCCLFCGHPEERL